MRDSLPRVKQLDLRFSIAGQGTDPLALPDFGFVHSEWPGIIHRFGAN
jgi:hypothetical protein